ncbi:alanine--tRNA ligase [Carboxydothermus ferrireducens]|uniref:Alanine--tRNA ligase n=1 Tax=Carboxydothermus ferrireducens DSM 11255 TaxID=1119529 RepID=A0ABX2R5H7_9THEO|nr:alanine--tRNA ligase [Carboxydothermus ferrireducens]NYE56419.1 alanyl-tRNA synthetase [Carboxydothermus ferrireducens DSM 11255]
MLAREIREKFLKFFESKGHKILPSASLIPANDPSLLWTAAGMVPFKPYFTGAAVPEVRRVTTCQKCLRTPDIESVGRTARHHTFFEMLGNFSFGDYFKKEAITWAWEFVTEHLGISKDKLYITIYLDDDEAFDIWHNVVGVPAERITRLGKDTNFWEIGVGPCGPCSEIYVDLGPEKGCGSPDCGVACDCGRFLEIWNLVFIQFFRDEQGNYTPLEQKGIDTGMGLERVASVLQGVPSNFDTDIFREIMDYAAQILGVKYGYDEKVDVALKVIADHTRAITFAITDGALPSNEGRGYVIRRLLRRALRFGRLLDREEPFLHLVAAKVIEQMGDVYPELKEKADHTLKIIKLEEEKFRETLNQGLSMLAELMERLTQEGKKEIPGHLAFKLYDTYGFPIELTKEIAEEKGFTVDEEGFKQQMEEQRRRAREAREDVDYLSTRDAFLKQLKEELGEVTFVGYEKLSESTEIIAIIKNGQKVESLAAEEEGEIITRVTPFYPEGGGQVADKGEILGDGFKLSVLDVEKPLSDFILHKVKVVEGSVKVGDKATLMVDETTRMSTARNHTATHLLHKALKMVLGEHVNQAGSLVTPERLRFDFTHFEGVSDEDLRKIENIVNEAILRNLLVQIDYTTLDEARKAGVIALFDEKYGDLVRVVKIGEFSAELCGGTHVSSTGVIGFFKILGESSIGAGVRRIEALTGLGALEYVRSLEDTLQKATEPYKCTFAELPEKISNTLKTLKEKDREIEALMQKIASIEVKSLLNSVREIKGVKVLSAIIDGADMEGLRKAYDVVKASLANYVVLLAGVKDGKVNFLAGVDKNLTDKYHAGELVKEAAKIAGGGGGGRPDMAQAGGKNPEKVKEALQVIDAYVQSK